MTDKPRLLEALKAIDGEKFTPQAGHNSYALDAMLTEIQALTRAAIKAAKGDA